MESSTTGMGLKNVILAGLCCALMCGPGMVSAQSGSKARRLAVPCPPVIANKNDGIMRSTGPRGSSGPYYCYRSTAQAKKGGFTSVATAKDKDYTGWYRVVLTITKNTCDPNPPAGGPVLFLEVKQNSAGVFGQFCPSIGSFSGIRSGGGLVMSALSNFTQAPQDSMCDDGKVQRHQYLELTKVVDGATGFSAKYTQVESCPTASSNATCTRQYSGVAFYETHTIWPVVSEDLNQLAPNCNTALTRCVECHPELG
ncbi:MAG: hypothetical protein J0M12_01665 [Deltaproteobacteria bacterium]|nr:hypothetical protein [Deltaproteobacteria bacterium]